VTAVPFVSGVWKQIVIAASSGTVTITNPAAFPIYVVVFDASDKWLNWMKIQASGSNSFFVAPGFTAVRGIMFTSASPNVVVT
jgi:hypothetical protein